MSVAPSPLKSASVELEQQGNSVDPMETSLNVPSPFPCRMLMVVPLTCAPRNKSAMPSPLKSPVVNRKGVYPMVEEVRLGLDWKLPSPLPRKTATCELPP